MVRRGLGGERGRRGQVLLIGAVVVAFIILALVPVFNGVFAPDSAGSSEPPEVDDGVVTAREELHTTARELAVRVGHRDEYASADPLVDRLDAALANYSRVRAEASVEGRDRFVNTSLNGSAPGTVTGVRVIQPEMGRVTMPTPGNPHNWWLVNPSSKAELGWFVMRVDATNVSRSTPFVVTVDNGTHETTVEVDREDASDDLRVNVSGDAGTTDEPVICDETSGQVVLDLYRGRAADRNCAFPGFEGIDGPVSIRVEDGDGMTAVYEFVLRDPSGLNPQVAACVGGGAANTEPCHTPVLWQLSLTTTVNGGRTSYTDTVNVSVYGGDA